MFRRQHYAMWNSVELKKNENCSCYSRWCDRNCLLKNCSFVTSAECENTVYLIDTVLLHENSREMFALFRFSTKIDNYVERMDIQYFCYEETSTVENFSFRFSQFKQKMEKPDCSHVGHHVYFFRKSVVEAEVWRKLKLRQEFQFFWFTYVVWP